MSTEYLTEMNGVEHSQENLLLRPREVEYAITETGLGIWRRHMSVNGQMFAEFKTHLTLFGIPFVHITWGRCPETMRRITARGVIAIGRFAVGGLAIGQVSMGVFTLGQAGFGIAFGVGQATTGLLAIGQLAIGGLIGLGQFATGHMAIGQIAFGSYVLAQVGIGEHVWDMVKADPLAVQFFRQLLFK